MGQFSKSKYSDSHVCPPCLTCQSQPDPSRFTVLWMEQGPTAFGHVLLEVKYSNCSNYEGKKIILMKISQVDLLNLRILDPHFNKDGKILARFLPTDDGWKMGLAMLHLLVGNL